MIGYDQDVEKMPEIYTAIEILVRCRLPTYLKYFSS